MKRRSPKYVARLEQRLDRLWGLRQAPALRGGHGRWPLLPADVLWRFQFAGVRHLIRRGDPFAEQWLSALEQSAAIAHGRTLLSGPGLQTDQLQKIAEIIDRFSMAPQGRGKAKSTGTDWGPVEGEVRQITWEFERLFQKIPRWGRLPKADRDARLSRFARALFPPRLTLTRLQVNNLSVALTRGARPAAVVVVAASRRSDPDRLADSLRKWNKSRGHAVVTQRNEKASSVQR